MKRSLCLLLAGAVLMLAGGTAEAKGHMAKANLYDKSGASVQLMNGQCVRTKWDTSYDQCKRKPVKDAYRSERAKSIFFSFSSSQLTAESKNKLTALATSIKQRSDVKGVRITGFADRIGTAEANEKLSKKRADAVRRYLVNKGVVNASVTEIRWFGEGLPSTNCPKSLGKADLVKCLQYDRRVDIVVDTVGGWGFSGFFGSNERVDNKKAYRNKGKLYRRGQSQYEPRVLKR